MMISTSRDGTVAKCLLTEKGDPSVPEVIRTFDGPITNLLVVNGRSFVGLHFGDSEERSIIELNPQGQQVQHSEPFIFHASGLAAVDNARTIIGVGQDRSLRFMDGKTLDTQVTFFVDEIFNRIVVAPDDSMLVTTTREGSLIVYEAR